jgi:polar amino acid transport system substrate-binding protein
MWFSRTLRSMENNLKLLVRIPAIVACLLIAVSLPTSLIARNISMLTVEWIPHYGPGLPENGLTTALVKAAFKAGGHSSEVEFVPWTQALKEVKEGTADVVMGAYRNQKREIDYYFSEEIYFLDTGLIARPGLNKYTYATLEDLSPYTIGVSRGWVNSEEFDAADYLNKEIAKNPVLNIRKLFRGRIDMTVMNFDLFRYEARQEGFCITNVEFMYPPLESQGLHIMASRRISDYQSVIDDFNRGLEQIRKNGTFQRIVNRFNK